MACNHFDICALYIGVGQRLAHLKTVLTTLEVKIVNTLITARTIRNTLLSVAAVTAITFPLFISASSADTTQGNTSLLNAEKKEISSNDPASLYTKLEIASRKMCGSSNIKLTGSVRRSAATEECYEGTLTAAVERLDNSEVSALHQKQNH